MNAMAGDGVIAKAWEKHRKRLERNIETVDCAGVPIAGTKENADVLGLRNLGGIFIFHYGFVIIAILIAIVGYFLLIPL